MNGYNFQRFPPIYNYFDIGFCVKKRSNYAIQHLQINTSGLTDICMDMSSVLQISDHQQSWGYEDGPWKGPGLPLLVAADFLKRILDK